MNKFLFIIIFVFLLFSRCTNNTEGYDKYGFNETKKNKVLVSVKEIFETFPSPVETAKSISKAKVKFNQNILNPVNNVPYYESSKSLALNLGVYCADLSYAGFYEQNQLVSSYLSAIKTIADNLGITQIMDEKDILKIEDNISNQDSLRRLIEEVFLSSGRYLNEDNRPEMAILVLVGAWIEGMYIAMQLATQSVEINKELAERIASQRKSLGLVVNALANYSDYAVVNDVYKDMLKLQRIYKKTNLRNKTPTSLIKNDDKINNKVYITPEIFINLFQEINKIRNSYTH
ncbi:MAG: hypothetical protein L3J74_10270 [Bacteroidales bacterium]|nr:hypothetical protein [Bacteroidales bacterium]